MSEIDNSHSRLPVIFAAVAVIGVIVIGAAWSGIRLPTFRSELDLPIGEPSPNSPPWKLGTYRWGSPDESLDELNACIAQAQYNLPRFKKALRSPKSTQSKFCICVKRRDNDNDGFVLVWYENIRSSSDRFQGTPLEFYNWEYSGYDLVDKGSCDVAEDEIVDWLYYDDGKIVGAYSSEYFQRNR